MVTGAKYNVQFKMYCQRREETIDVNVDCVFPLLVPGSDGNPTVRLFLPDFLRNLQIIYPHLDTRELARLCNVEETKFLGRTHPNRKLGVSNSLPYLG